MKQTLMEKLEAHLTQVNKDLGFARLAAGIEDESGPEADSFSGISVELKKASEHIRNALSLVRVGLL